MDGKEEIKSIIEHPEYMLAADAKSMRQRIQAEKLNSEELKPIMTSTAKEKGKSLLSDVLNGKWFDLVCDVADAGDKLKDKLEDAKKVRLLAECLQKSDNHEKMLTSLVDLITDPYGLSLYLKIVNILSESPVDGDMMEILSDYLSNLANKDDLKSVFSRNKTILNLIAKSSPQALMLLRESDSWPIMPVPTLVVSAGGYVQGDNTRSTAQAFIKMKQFSSIPVEDMQMAMSDLEKYMNSESNTDPLIQASLIHYQFETIHPFLDGNGRIGRLLITLFLMEKGVLSTPALYISYYLKMNRIEYYDRMTEVRRTGDYEQWVTFFLQAFADSADDAIQTVDKLTALHNKSISLLDDLSSRQKPNVLKVFTYLEANPIIDIRKTAAALALSYNTVAKAAALLQEKGILKQTDKAGKTKIYSYHEYLTILRKDT